MFACKCFNSQTISFLLVSEIKVFTSSSIEMSTTIQNNFDNSEYTILSINVTIFDVPCSSKYSNMLVVTVEFTNDMKMGVEEEIEGDRLART